MFPPKTKMCHLTGFTKSCFDLTSTEACQGRWGNVQWTNAQTGIEENFWGCVDDVGKALALDQTRRLNGVQAAIEAMRNEVTKLQVEQIARSERQHREALAPLDDMRGMQRLAPPPPGITVLSLDQSSGEPN